MESKSSGLSRHFVRTFSESEAPLQIFLGPSWCSTRHQTSMQEMGGILCDEDLCKRKPVAA